MKLRERLPRGIKSITILRATALRPAGASFERVEILPKRRKKQSRGVARIVERVVLGRARVQSKVAEEYLARHRRSARRRRNGWLRDLAQNRMRSIRLGRRAFGLSRLLG